MLFFGNIIKISQTKVHRKFAPTCKGSVISKASPSGGKKPLIKAKISEALIIHQKTNCHFGQPSESLLRYSFMFVSPFFCVIYNSVYGRKRKTSISTINPKVNKS